MSKNYLDLTGLTRFLQKLRTTFASLVHTHTKDEITDLVIDTEMSDTSENPVQNKVISAELDSINDVISNKADSEHTHDEYETKEDAEEKLKDAKDYSDVQLMAEVSARESGDTNALREAKAYTDEQVATIQIQDVSGQISAHNVATDAHNDIRELISGLSTRLNTLADSDDTTLDQMSEVVAYIKSNKELIEAITTSKVSVEDIIDNLTTNVSNKVLSAAQGVAIKSLIDELEEELNNHTHEIDDVNGLRNLFSNYATVDQLNNKADSEHNHNDLYYTKTEIENLELVTVDDIDTICGTSIQTASNMKF